MSDRMEQAWCKMVADAAWDASGKCPLPGSDVIVWAHQQMSALESKLAAAGSTIASQLDTIKALTVGTDGSTPAIVQLGRMDEKLADAEEELTRFRNGYQGSCYACETVGEKNAELENKVKVLREALVAVSYAYDYPQEIMKISDRALLATMPEADRKALATTAPEAGDSHHG